MLPSLVTLRCPDLFQSFIQVSVAHQHGDIDLINVKYFMIYPLSHTSLREAKTLILACHDKFTGKLPEWGNDVFMLRSSGNIVHRHHYRLQEEIRHFVEEKECSQILVVGHVNAEAIEQLMLNLSADSPAASLDFNLKPLLGPHQNLLSVADHDHLLVSLNVIQQCNLVLDYKFIHKRVTRQSLNLIGVVAQTDTHDARQVFCNGIGYNHLITSN